MPHDSTRRPARTWSQAVQNARQAQGSEGTPNYPAIARSYFRRKGRDDPEFDGLDLSAEPYAGIIAGEVSEIAFYEDGRVRRDGPARRGWEGTDDEVIEKSWHSLKVLLANAVQQGLPREPKPLDEIIASGKASGRYAF